MNFSQDLQDDFYNITTLGYLEHTFQWCGHSFGIKTLNIEEELAIAKLLQPYIGTLGELKAIWSTTAAGSLLSINGKPWMPPIDPDGDVDSHMKMRYNVIKKWQHPITQAIANEVIDLNVRRDRLVTDTEKKFGSTTTKSDDTFDPLNAEEG